MTLIIYNAIGICSVKSLVEKYSVLANPQMCVTSRALRLSYLLTAAERHVAHVLKEPFAVPKLAESHSYLQIGSWRGSWRWKERQRGIVSDGTVCCCQFSTGLSLFLCLWAPFLMRKKRKSQKLQLCQCLFNAVYSVSSTSCLSLALSIDIPQCNNQWLLGFWSNMLCSKSVGRAKYATKTLSFHISTKQITYL